MSAADRIKNRNEVLRGIREGLVEVAEEFHKDHSDRLDISNEVDYTEENISSEDFETEDSNEDSGFSIDDWDDDFETVEVDTLTEDLDSGSTTDNTDLHDDFRSKVEKETEYSWSTSLLEPTLRDLIQDQEVGRSFSLESREAAELEKSNYSDYFEMAAEKLDIEDPDGVYLCAGCDTVPAVEFGGNWKYVGLDYEREDFEKGDANINFVNQDITQGLPQLEDGSQDIVLIKTLGSTSNGSELEEAVIEQAYSKVSDDGYILSDRDIDEAKAVGTIEPAPVSFHEQLTDPNTNIAAYNATKLTVYQKDQ